MQERWIVYSLIAIFLFGAGSLFGKLASINEIPARVYFFEALGTLTVFTCFFLLKRQEILNGISINYFGLLMGITWGLGTVFFILALEKSKLSVLVPFTALYPEAQFINHDRLLMKHSLGSDPDDFYFNFSHGTQPDIDERTIDESILYGGHDFNCNGTIETGPEVGIVGPPGGWRGARFQ